MVYLQFWLLIKFRLVIKSTHCTSLTLNVSYTRPFCPYNNNSVSLQSAAALIICKVLSADIKIAVRQWERYSLRWLNSSQVVHMPTFPHVCSYWTWLKHELTSSVYQIFSNHSFWGQKWIEADVTAFKCNYTILH